MKTTFIIFEWPQFTDSTLYHANSHYSVTLTLIVSAITISSFVVLTTSVKTSC